ncbi:MAG: hypothetical protein A4E45_00329 [Methanosaeta sp. PtaB.Bin039]|nr:MAG: hypothetical protein A4E45_00329 [Methanosaeta sp. PtaB.Bin039]HOT07423.1 DUF116 domain-containing protein [Methanotrichaceae archaeon]HQF17382.1 DUF116 domain-containing protein [Methanotrichaceae archaeon]HQI91144.1 DUF116 domain-containing protein [Methanotrichaceae archaeon]HQJ29213.1 DUF116 domain-containing protein [Methanotrichaceae archaeon]
MIQYLDHVYYLVGKVAVWIGASLLLLSLVVALLILYSFRTKKFYFARVMLIGLSLVENLVKALFWLARADDAIVDEVGVSLRNYINRGKFYRTPVGSRFIFMPQCVRSVDCPAKLTPEGIMCVECGRCDVGAAKRVAEEQGYRFFVVPGSSFIKRIIRKYRPKAIVGVGCQMEIKEGLTLCHSHDIPALGVPLSKAGCVATTLDWDEFYDVLSGAGNGSGNGRGSNVAGP